MIRNQFRKLLKDWQLEDKLHWFIDYSIWSVWHKIGFKEGQKNRFVRKALASFCVIFNIILFSKSGKVEELLTVRDFWKDATRTNMIC